MEEGQAKRVESRRGGRESSTDSALSQSPMSQNVEIMTELKPTAYF